MGSGFRCYRGEGVGWSWAVVSTRSSVSSAWECGCYQTGGLEGIFRIVGMYIVLYIFECDCSCTSRGQCYDGGSRLSPRDSPAATSTFRPTPKVRLTIYSRTNIWNGCKDVCCVERYVGYTLLQFTVRQTPQLTWRSAGSRAAASPGYTRRSGRSDGSSARSLRDSRSPI